MNSSENCRQHPAPAVNRLMRLRPVLSSRGVGHSKHYADIAAGLFTEPLKNGRLSLWPESEVCALNAALIAGKTDDEIRALVKRLIAARQYALEGSL